MKEKPVLFNADMVRALLEGRKTVTRRVVKPHHLLALGSPYHRKHPDIPDNIILEKLCHPPYIPGDVLYVRETWAHPSESEIKNGAEPNMYLYAADSLRPAAWEKWRPSIHMPKEAARIFLKVTGVRAERLKVIMEDPPGPNNQVVREGFIYGCDFIAAWNRLIKPADLDKYGWDANPWVWVIEFERVDKPEGWPI